MLHHVNMFSMFEAEPKDPSEDLTYLPYALSSAHRT